MAVGVLGAVESLLRVFFYYESVFAGAQLLQPMPPDSTMNVVNPINLAIGGAGLVAIVGLLLSTGWGYWGMLAVSLVTIAFDGVSFAAVSSTALAGLILPILFLIVLIPGRAVYFASSAGERS